MVLRQTVGINVPAGSYDEIEFEIHKIPTGDQEDAAFAAAHPEFADQSIGSRELSTVMRSRLRVISM